MAPYTLEEGSTGNADLSDTQAFLSLLARLRAGGAANDEERDAASLFDFGREVVVARAPGRLDVMGGIADYSGSLVLQMPLAEACFAAAQAGPGDGLVRVVSLGADGHRSAAFSLPAGQLMDAAGAPAPYEAARTALAGSWAAYPLGAVHALCVESGKAHFAATGLRLLLSSAVPEGKGVSSSAAVEVASLFAAAAVAGTHVGGRTAALWCQLGENRVVGAACGVMDQMASSLGQPGALLALLCRPAEVQGVLQLGSHVAVWGLDSGVRHSVGGSDYGSVRAAAFMAKTAAQIGPGRHLTEVAPHAWERDHAPLLAEAMAGKAFADAHGPAHGDAVTVVHPASLYPLRASSGHAVHEHFRARTFAALLGCSPGDEQLALLGQLMHQSHESYSKVGLGCGGTDRLVRLVEEAGPAKGLFGAKISGGGSGGTVVVLGRPDAGPAVEEIAAAYARETGHTPHIFRGSSLGAAAFGVLRVRFSGA